MGWRASRVPRSWVFCIFFYKTGAVGRNRTDDLLLHSYPCFKCIYQGARLYLEHTKWVSSPCQSFERLRRYGLGHMWAINRNSGCNTRFPPCWAIFHHGVALPAELQRHYFAPVEASKCEHKRTQCFDNIYYFFGFANPMSTSLAVRLICLMACSRLSADERVHLCSRYTIRTGLLARVNRAPLPRAWRPNLASTSRAIPVYKRPSLHSIM